MIVTFEPKFNLNDKVYHITKDSPEGIIIDITYSVSTRRIAYNVIFGPYMDQNVWCVEEELSNSKTF